MRTLIVVAAVLAGCALAPGADDKYVSKEGKFKVAFPKGAKPVTVEQEVGKGVKITLVKAESDGLKAGAGYMVLPESAKGVPAKSLFDLVVKGTAGKPGAKVTTSKDFEFGKDKLPARESVIEGPTGIMKQWLILDGSTLYSLHAGGKGEEYAGKDAAAFLESFELTK